MKPIVIMTATRYFQAIKIGLGIRTGILPQKKKKAKLTIKTNHECDRADNHLKKRRKGRC